MPTTGPVGTAATWVCIDFSFASPGRLAGIRFYVAAFEDGNYRGFIYDATNVIDLRSVTAGIRSSTGSAAWQQAWFRPWLRISTSLHYRLCVMYPKGKLFRNNTGLVGTVTHNGIEFNSSFQTTSLVPELATITLNTNANAVDVLFYPD